jgi:hypothetical protein
VQAGTRGTHYGDVFKPVPDVSHDAFHVTTLLQKAEPLGKGYLADDIELSVQGQYK